MHPLLANADSLSDEVIDFRHETVLRPSSSLYLARANLVHPHRGPTPPRTGYLSKITTSARHQPEALARIPTAPRHEPEALARIPSGEPGSKSSTDN